MNEPDAIKLCLKHRDPRGFEYLFHQYRREAYLHAFGFTGNTEDASDMCQEAFMKAFVSITRLRELERFYPWFYRILRNTCLNLIKRREVARKHRDQEMMTTQDGLEAGDPLGLLKQKESTGEVFVNLGRLRLDQREMLMLKYFQDLDYRQISALLNIPRGTVMSRLYNARKAYRDLETPDAKPLPPSLYDK